MSASLSPERIAELLEPYVGAAVVPEGMYGKLAAYLELILKWNARVNLTAIREPEEMVRRHFGESLFAGLVVGKTTSLLDLGSGAGFPGIPMQLLRPEMRVTLAEARGRKAAFLREAVRTLELGTEIWAARAEGMPLERRFDTVALRAVDGMNGAVTEASRRAERQIVILGTRDARYPTLPQRFQMDKAVEIPGSREAVIWMARA
jgi:16S rRNA (guanine527-N7)-methyltransferase